MPNILNNFIFSTGIRGNYNVTGSNELDDSGLLLRNTKDNEYVNMFRA